jgi:hypothetical protein
LTERVDRSFAKPQQQMILLLGYVVSLAATFVMSVAVLTGVLAATTANKAPLYHLHRSDTVQLSKHGNKQLLGKSRLVTARGPSKTKASWSVVERQSLVRSNVTHFEVTSQRIAPLDAAPFNGR